MATRTGTPKSYEAPCHDACETSPLLEDGTRDGSQNREVDAPFPTGQILLLCYARVMEGLGFFSIFPYIPQMIQHNGGLPSSQVGFYSGLVESSSSIAEMAALPFWCYMSDRFGRRPALIFSLAGMTIGPLLFGFSDSIWKMMVSRCLAGFFAGSGLIIRTAIAEITTPETQPTAYGWLSMTDSLGALIGPLIGGALADPAGQYPQVFGGIPFFESYRFALPGIVISLVNASAVLSSFWLKEPSTKAEDQSASLEQSEDQHTSYRQLCNIHGLPVVLWVYSQVWLLASVLVSVVPVALFTQVSLGGIGFSTSKISIYLGTQAASQTLWFLVAFPKIQRRFGTKGTLRVCAVGYPLLFCSYIIMNALLRQGSQESVVWFWIMIVLTAIAGPSVFMSYGASQLIINEACPDPRRLGSLNTIALMLLNLTRIFAPGAATAVYAVGVKGQILEGYLGWVVFIVISGGFYVSHRWLPNR